MQKSDHQLYAAALDLFSTNVEKDFLANTTEMAKAANRSIDKGGASAFLSADRSKLKGIELVSHLFRVSLFYVCWSVVLALSVSLVDGPYIIMGILAWILGMCVETVVFLVTRSKSQGTFIEIFGAYWYCVFFSFWIINPTFELITSLLSPTFDETETGETISILLFFLFLFVLPFLATRLLMYKGYGLREALRAGTLTGKRAALQFIAITLANFRIGTPAYFCFVFVAHIPNFYVDDGAFVLIYLDKFISLVEGVLFFVFLACPAFFGCTRVNGSIARSSQLIIGLAAGLVLGGFIIIWAYAIGLLAATPGWAGFQYSSGPDRFTIWRPLAATACLLFGCGISLHPLNRFGFEEWKKRIRFSFLLLAYNFVAAGATLVMRSYFFPNRYLFDPPQSFAELFGQATVYFVAFSLSFALGTWLTKKLMKGLPHGKGIFLSPIFAGQYEGIGFIMPRKGIRGLLTQLWMFTREVAILSFNPRRSTPL